MKMNEKTFREAWVKAKNKDEDVFISSIDCEISIYATKYELSSNNDVAYLYLHGELIGIMPLNKIDKVE
jgi:hypothetical protein